MPITDNLISFWELEETSGTRNDAHGTNHLTDVNTVTSATGKVGTAAQFTRANNEELNRASNASLQTGDIDFLVGCWVYLDAKPGYLSFMSKVVNSTGAFEYELGYDFDTDRYSFAVSAAGAGWPSARVDATSFGSPATGAWHFVLAWHDSVANTINIQVNDGTVNSTAHSGGVASTSSPFAMGTWAGFSYHDGRLDQAGFWKRVLTADDRTWLYNAGAGRSYADLTAPTFLAAWARGSNVVIQPGF